MKSLGVATSVSSRDFPGKKVIFTVPVSREKWSGSREIKFSGLGVVFAVASTKKSPCCLISRLSRVHFAQFSGFSGKSEGFKCSQILCGFPRDYTASIPQSCVIKKCEIPSIVPLISNLFLKVNITAVDSQSHNMILKRGKWDRSGLGNLNQYEATVGQPLIGEWWWAS